MLHRAHVNLAFGSKQCYLYLMITRSKAPVVNLKPNPAKIAEAILFILSQARSRNVFATQYDIVKTLFLADKRHLNLYGRPITFDNYFAMKHGPVPSLAYDLLKGNRAALEQYGAFVAWDSRYVAAKQFHFVPRREPDLDELAPSEIELLTDCFGAVKSLGFGEVRKLTHEDPAYIDAWEDSEEENSSYPISLGMLFDVPNMDVAEELAFVSKHAA
jgi:uncharacterized phage-associated protein